MAVNTKPKTKAPSGLSIKRDTNKFVCSWKIADKDYGGGQVFQYKVGSKEWKSVKLGAKVTSKAFSVTTSNWYPTTKKALGKVQFKICATRSAYTANSINYTPVQSDYVSKEFEIKKPRAPKVAVTLGTWPKATFSWSVKKADNENRWFTSVEYQTVLLKDSNITQGKKITNWKKNISGASTKFDSSTLAKTWYRSTSNNATGALDITEDSSLLSDGHSYTRWFRIRARGPRGTSDWIYKKHVYALPNTPKITKWKVNEKSQAQGYVCQVWYKIPRSASKPINSIKAQYALAVPDAGMECPDGASWKDGITSLATDATGGSVFAIDSLLAADQCLFVRVNAIYDDYTAYGVPVMVDTGFLTNPSLTSVSYNSTTHKATVTATNGSSVSDSYLVIKYLDGTDPNGIDIGIIPHGQTSAIVQCPEFTSSDAVRVGVYAVVSVVKRYYLTADTVADLTKDYYEAYERTYHTIGYQLSTVTAGDNPAEMGLYELDTTGIPEAELKYHLTTDTTVDAGKTYYAYVSQNDGTFAYEVVASPTGNPLANEYYEAYGLTTYAVTPVMRSSLVTDGGTVPVAPNNVSAFQSGRAGTIRVTWDWSWDDANAAELSWSDHEDAWESTDEPSTYLVTKMNASAWNISGLDTGQEWFVRVRLVASNGDNDTYGAYSDIKRVFLSSAPAIPSLSLSQGIITEDGSVTASWSYTPTDGSAQAFATIAEVTVTEDGKLYTEIAQVETESEYTIYAEEQGWNNGDSHVLVVKVTSESGIQSDDWSNEVTVYVAEPLTCTFYATSLTDTTQTSTDEDGNTVSRTVKTLEDLPLTATITGAGDDGLTALIIERAEAYHSDRPDETSFNGFEGETVAVYQQIGEDQISINLDDEGVIGRFDDDAQYRLIATVQDGIGQYAENTIDFEVHWSHQAAIPSAAVTYESGVAVLTPVAPQDTLTWNLEQTDTCDIYRLSVDKPELIYEGAEFGEDYVDPYPTIGEYGGHRFVFKTANGDYITDDHEFAWYDTGEDQNDRFDYNANIIEFENGRVELAYNIDLDNSWEKDFEITKYLGGSVQGDWNPAVSRTGSVAGVAVTTEDQDLIQQMRRLATYPGICHVRTKEGSSYPADVQVTEKYAQNTAHKVATFTLKITRVDKEVLDGLTYADWAEEEEQEEP